MKALIWRIRYTRQAVRRTSVSCLFLWWNQSDDARYAHWYALPKRLRDKIWATYRPGQEITKTPSVEYLAAAREVQDWIARGAKPEFTPAEEILTRDTLTAHLKSLITEA